MNAWKLVARVVTALGALVLATTCALVGSEPRIGPTAADRSVDSATAPTPSSGIATAASQRDERASRSVPSRVPAHAQRSAPSPKAAQLEPVPDRAAPTVLRLPVAKDLGPNYFELFAATSDSSPGSSRDGPVSVSLVAFGFSERAKLRDERVERDGPLAAIARVIVHPTTESASRFSAADSAAAGLELSATARTPNPLGLTAALTGPPPSTRELAPGLNATHSLLTGWFVALDGSPVRTVVEQWTIVHTRSVLTLVLVWGSQVSDGWGQALVRRLVQGGPESAASHAS